MGAFWAEEKRIKLLFNKDKLQRKAGTGQRQGFVDVGAIR